MSDAVTQTPRLGSLPRFTGPQAPGGVIIPPLVFPQIPAQPVIGNDFFTKVWRPVPSPIAARRHYPFYMTVHDSAAHKPEAQAKGNSCTQARSASEGNRQTVDPGENTEIVRTGKSHVLHANKIELRLTQQQAAHDVAVEVLIREQPQHGRSLPLSPRKQPSADFTQVALLTFNPLPYFFGLLLAARQVVLDFALMT